jgi:hypothetical protein
MVIVPVPKKQQFGDPRCAVLAFDIAGNHTCRDLRKSPKLPLCLEASKGTRHEFYKTDR